MKNRKFYIKGEQKRIESSEKFQQDCKSLNLVQNTEGIYECRGRIQGIYPIYLPKESLLAEKIIRVAHKKTMHGGVTITMSNIKTHYWIPSLREISKSIIKKCHCCVRYRAMPFSRPKPGPLSRQRAQECQRRSYLLNNRVLHIIILVWCIQSYISRISTKFYYPRFYQEYGKANNKTGES